MKKAIFTTSLIALLLIILLSFVPTVCNRYMHSAIKDIESRINLMEPSLYNKTLPAGQFQTLLDDYPEVRMVLGNRADQWQENAENLSIETVLTNINDKISTRVKRTVLFLQTGIVVLSIIGLAAFYMYKKEHSESSGSTPGIRFGE